MKLKICGLNNAENIAALLALAPDYIGLVFYPGSPRYAGATAALPSFMKSIRGVAKVGVFVNEEQSGIQRTVKDYGLDYVQLHGSETPELCKGLNNDIPVWKAFSVGPFFDFGLLEAYAGTCAGFLFDTPARQYGGSGKQFDWSLLGGKRIPLPFMLSGGIGPEDAPRVKALSHTNLMGIDLNSRFEQSPGIKNVELIKSFTDAIRN